LASAIALDSGLEVGLEVEEVIPISGAFRSCRIYNRACSAGYKPTLLQLFGLLQLQSIERKIL
jgi:hypothetical protein